MYDKHMLPM